MKLLRNTIFTLLAFGALLGIFVLLSNIHINSKPKDNRMRVVATFYPMAEFAKAVGGANVNVTTLVKPGLEPHDYEPSPQDLARIYDSSLFVYNGAGLETWVDKIQKQLEGSKTFTVDASYAVKTLHKDPSDTGSKSATDPHVWMDPQLAIKEVSAILQGYIAVDPQNMETYRANALAYVRQLVALNDAFTAGLAHCQLHTIVTSHQAFSYLAQEYGLQAIGIAGLSPDDEPSPQKLAQVASYVKDNTIKYVFFESLASPKLSQTIASETGAQTITFNPLEGLTGSELKAGKNYVSVQKDNLQALRTALECQ
ncbi:MAG TPA: zinc ABC transporter substrate-binding protein [Candidatus Saccharimonadales bacterium]|nr:zinc ABC transporter substrate-binding protein [Candidatus Saccharimonadales bacterium]